MATALSSACLELPLLWCQFILTPRVIFDISEVFIYTECPVCSMLVKHLWLIRTWMSFSLRKSPAVVQFTAPQYLFFSQKLTFLVLYYLTLSSFSLILSWTLQWFPRQISRTFSLYILVFCLTNAGFLHLHNPHLPFSMTRLPNSAWVPPLCAEAHNMPPGRKLR